MLKYYQTKCKYKYYIYEHYSDDLYDLYMNLSLSDLMVSMLWKIEHTNNGMFLFSFHNIV